MLARESPHRRKCRLIQQGGAATGADKAKLDPETKDIIVTDGLLLWAGKKKYCRVQLVD
jgi:tyrosyl-tRNA synthetase